MSLALSTSSITEEILDLINKKCVIKPTKTQYNDNPSLVHCFEVDEENDTVYIPFGLWKEFVYKEDLTDGYKINPKLKCKKELYTLQTDPKGYRDQDAVFQEALIKLKRDRVVFLALSTGFGKTSLGNYFTCHFKLKTVILCHIDEVNKQWVIEYKEFSNAKVQRVTGNKGLDPNADVYVIGIQKAKNIPRDQLSDIGLVILDECHIATITAFSKTLLRFQPKYVIALSATPERSDGLHKLLTMYFGPKKDFIHRQEIKNFTVYKVCTSFKPKIKYTFVKGNHVPDWTTIINSIEYNEERHDIIVKTIMDHPKNNILVLSSRKKQAFSICNKLLNKKERDFKLLVGTIKDEEREDIEAIKGYINIKEKKRITVAIAAKAGTGFNDPTLDMLIVASDCKNVKQWEGRIRTVDNIIYDFVDNYKTFESHWNLRESWYLKKGANISIINLKGSQQDNVKQPIVPSKRLLK